MGRRSIRAVQITAEVVKENPNVYVEVRNGLYQVVYTSPEIILADGAMFIKTVLRANNTSFSTNLVCIAIDEAHVAWAWQSFRKKYCNFFTLRSYHLSVPFLLLLAILALNVLGFLHSGLHLRPRTLLYRISIDRPNITQIAGSIRTSGFDSLKWLLQKHRTVYDIPKTMIFADSIHELQKLVTYLWRRLPRHAKINGRAKLLIRAYSASLTWGHRAANLAALRNGDAKIVVYTDAAGLGVDISDVEIIVQWKIADHLTLAGLVQRIGRAGRDSSVEAIAVVMTQPSYILPEQDTDKTMEFAKLRSPVTPETELETKAIISDLYFGLLISRQTKSSIAYDKIDPALL